MMSSRYLRISSRSSWIRDQQRCAFCCPPRPALGCPHKDKAVPTPQTLLPARSSSHSLLGHRKWEHGMIHIPMGLWCFPCPSASPNLWGLKEGSGYARDDKAYHYSRLLITAGLNWTEVIDFTWIIGSIQWGPADWTPVCPVGNCSLKWLNWAKPTLQWPHTSCQATVNWFYNPFTPWSSHGTAGWHCWLWPSQTYRVKIPITALGAIWDSFLIKNNIPMRSSHKHCWC